MNFPTHLHDLWRGKRDNTFNPVLREVIAVRVVKIGRRLDFSCANRDGNVAVGECIYRNNASDTPAKYQPSMAVTEPLEQGAAAIHRRHQAEGFIAYFHSCSNSYDTLE